MRSPPNKYRYIQYFDGSAELYDLEHDPNEHTNLIHNPEHRSRINTFKTKLPKEPQWKHFIRYKRFKAVVPSDGSDMLLYHHDTKNHLEERTSEAKQYPAIVKEIENWLKSNPNAPKRINLNRT